MLSVYLMPASVSRFTSSSMLSTPTQKCLSLPPYFGLPSLGSGFGSSIKWIISGPIHNHAPRYGSLSSGRSRLTFKPKIFS